MSLCAVSDAFLAAHAAKGDGAAFGELARRYRPLIRRASWNPPAGVEVEDLRQEALLGLLATCFSHDPRKGAFAALARRNVRQRVNRARYAATARKHLVLNQALRDGDQPSRSLEEGRPAPQGWNPAVVVELRDTLRERVELARQPRPDGRRRYSDEQITRALALLAEGRTIKQAAFAVGASREQVKRWADRAGQPYVGRRCFTPDEIRTAVELVHSGATLREAAAAVGASNATVLKWVRKAA
jgi:transposase-like protein